MRLPHGEIEEPKPPSAEHVEAVYRLLRPAQARRCSGSTGRAPASRRSTRLVGDYDEPRRRIRLRAADDEDPARALGGAPDALADAIEATLPPREDRDPDARLFPARGADPLRTAIARACRATGIPPWRPHDLRHRRISLLHHQGRSWAEIGRSSASASG